LQAPLVNTNAGRRDERDVAAKSGWAPTSDSATLPPAHLAWGFLRHEKRIVVSTRLHWRVYLRNIIEENARETASHDLRCLSGYLVARHPSRACRRLEDAESESLQKGLGQP
jgi:hypothetical protein